MLKNLQPKVEYCLEHFPDTRNSDICLTIKIWESYYSHKLYKAKDGNNYVCLENMYDLPSEDRISRVRRIVQ